MALWRSWRALPALDRRLVREAAPLVLAVRLALWLLPFRLIVAALGRLPVQRGRHAPSARRVALAVATASRYVPCASCLTQALAAQALLRRYRHPAELRIGVARPAGRRLAAHAWVVCAGAVVIGDTGDLAAFRTLAPSR